MKSLTRISFFIKKELWIHTFSVPHFLRNCATSVQLLLCPLYFALIIPLNILLYILFLLFPMFHFICNCFLLCPLKFIVQLLKSDHCRVADSYAFFTTYTFYINVFILYILCQNVIFFFAFKPYFFFVTQFVLKLIVYTIFVAEPLFSTSETSYQFWAISLSALVYIIKYTVTFNSNYKFLLKKILKLCFILELIFEILICGKNVCAILKVTYISRLIVLNFHVYLFLLWCVSVAVPEFLKMMAHYILWFYRRFIRRGRTKMLSKIPDRGTFPQTSLPPPPSQLFVFLLSIQSKPLTMTVKG